MSNFSDKELTCKDCGNPFVWGAGEQKFLQQLVDDGKEDSQGNPIQFTEARRCKACRAKKKARFNK